MTPFFMAWGMFWIVPCPLRRWDEARRGDMLLCLPLIGLLIGAVWALAARCAVALGGPGLFGAAVLTALPWCLTGFIHLDGYMDCADAVLSRRERAERLRILKDSRVGSFAVIALGLLILLSFALFASMPLAGRELCLLFIPAATRSCAAAAVLGLAPLESSSYARTGGARNRGRALAALGMTAAFCVLAPLCCGRPGLSAPVGMLGCALTVALARRNLGGMSGDISGCAITLGELCAVAALTFL